jgi:ketosteroid isomerase-like protein
MFNGASTLLTIVALAAAVITDASDTSSPRKALLDWADSLESSEVERVLACYEHSDDITIIHSTGEVARGVDAVRNTYEQAFQEVNFEQVLLVGLQVYHDDDMAWATGKVVANTGRHSDGSKWKLEIRTSFVLRRKKNLWRIVLEHSSELPDVPRVKRRD